MIVINIIYGCAVSVGMGLSENMQGSQTTHFVPSSYKGKKALNGKRTIHIYIDVVAGTNYGLTTYLTTKLAYDLTGIIKICIKKIRKKKKQPAIFRSAAS